jgi:O-antigen/teichoic acid export membrane protein
MSEDKNSYKSITKAISLFGGVKVFQILISIIKNKFIAVLLGPSGMGISGMITSTTSLISSLTGCGLRTSAVRDVSQAHSSGDTDRINKTITVLRKLVFLTGILGTIITFCFSSYLSKWAFGNANYSLAFKIVSIILFLDQISIGQTVLLQGTFHYKYMAKASLFGSIVGLFATVPLYYIWGVKAIVPVIIITSLSNLLLTWIYSRKTPYERVKLTAKQIFSEGRKMLTLGAVIALTGVVNTGQTYLLRLFISRYGNITDVGLYTAGISIATSYIGVVLDAMGSDYAPRLSTIANDDVLMTQTINRQAILLTTILAPLITIFIVFIKQVTIILYSTKFIEITGMIEWIMYGMFFRALSWCISFCFVARGESKIFFWNELFSSSYSLMFSVLGYWWGHFTGMGIAFCLTYACYTLQMFVLARKRFGFYFNKDFLQIALPQIIICTFLFVVIKLLGYNIYRYILGAVAIFIVSVISYRQLDNMIDIKNILFSLKSKIKG